MQTIKAILKFLHSFDFIDQNIILLNIDFIGKQKRTVKSISICQ